ncbi:MAG: glycerate kinase [Peptococcaceae bacterium]|jgi:glycerate kinase|nr:glycerate kinase [Peptococcaceae bacterium]
MKVVIAMDSFKESLSTMQAGNAVKDGVSAAIPDADPVVLPMADGGEGTLEAIMSGLGGERISMSVCGPSGKRVAANYGVFGSPRCAIIEIGQAVGLSMLKPEERNPLYTTSYGVGEMILDAIERGIRDFIIGLGGSATNDAGLGMLEALGFRFSDEDKKLVGKYGRDIGRVCSIDISRADSRLKDCRFRLACDVNNPLVGNNGAAAVFGPQKGATPEIVAELDSAFSRFSGIAVDTLGRDMSWEPGAGAAGGLGFAFQAFLNAEMRRGVEVVMEAVGLEAYIRDAEIVVTGEGKLDKQTAMGKTPSGVAQLAKKYNTVVIALSGCLEDNTADLHNCGLDACFSILNMPQTMQEALESTHAEKNLRAAAEQVFRLVNVLKAEKKM